MAKASLVCVVVGEVYERYFEQLAADWFGIYGNERGGEWELVKLPGVAGWPSASDQRCRVILQHADELAGDYLYWIDADCRLLAPLTEEVFADGIVVTEHPGFPRGTEGPFEDDPMSLAYVAPEWRGQYFPGAFVGGRRDHFLLMARNIADWIDADKWRDIDAVWYDESYLNRYLSLEIVPSPKILEGRRYCYWQHWGWPAPAGTVIAHLDKTDAERAATGR
jgi:Glycosyltransferase family 6